MHYEKWQIIFIRLSNFFQCKHIFLIEWVKILRKKKIVKKESCFFFFAYSREWRWKKMQWTSEYIVNKSVSMQYRFCSDDIVK